MIIVIASRYDEVAKSLVARWRAHDARLLLCTDLSVCGWQYSAGDYRASTAVVEEQKIAQEEIHGVLTRIPCVYEGELLHIIPSDRAYVATEMTAFLTAWLSALSCPIFNRPTAVCLSGPNWGRERWTHAAAHVGIPIRPLRRHIALAVTETPKDWTAQIAPVTVTVVGDHCLGKVDEALAVQARSLADAAHVQLLSMQFSGSEAGSYFVDASIWPAITDTLADAMLACFSQDYRTSNRLVMEGV